MTHPIVGIKFTFPCKFYNVRTDYGSMYNLSTCVFMLWSEYVKYRCNPNDFETYDACFLKHFDKLLTEDLKVTHIFAYFTQRWIASIFTFPYLQFYQ